MVNIINLCKDPCDEKSPFFIKADCSGNDGKIVVTQNDIEVYTIPYKLHKTVTNYETFKKVLKPNTSTKVNLDANPVFYLFTPIFTSSFDWKDRNVQVVTSSNIEKIESNLYNTPNLLLNLGLVNSIETSSYNPIIKIPKVYTNEDVYIEIKDLAGNTISHTFNKYKYIINFNNRLLGNNKYFINIKYLQKDSNGNIIETTVKEYTIKIIKKKLATYDFISLYEEITNGNNSLDVDNDIEIILKDVPKGISLEQINIKIDDLYHFIIKERKLIKEEDNTYTAKIKIEIIDFLQNNKQYKIEITDIFDILNSEELEDREIIFKTNFFHRCVHKTNFSDVYLRSINSSENGNAYFYLVNNGKYDISIYGLIGYSDREYKIIRDRC